MGAFDTRHWGDVYNFYWKPTTPWPGEAPKRSDHVDAGWDLITSADCEAKPGQWVDVPIGIAIEIPDDTWGMILGRSSTLAKRRLLVPTSVIDAGYRGPLFVIAQNVGETVCEIEKGARIGQLIITPRVDYGPQWQWVEAEELTRSERGVKGFGSSGT